MKKLVLLFTFVALLFTQANAQFCTPDLTYTEPGIYPKQLPEAHVNEPYNETIQFKFPKDTSYLGFVVPIDSVEILSVEGLPKDFKYVCSNLSCAYKGGENGCVVITGTPKASDKGEHKIIIKARAKITFNAQSIKVPFQDTVPFTVSPETGIFSQDLKTVQVSNFPNPFSEVTNIIFNSFTPAQVSLKVYDLPGREVYTESFTAKTGENTKPFFVNDLKPGIYFYILQVGEVSYSKKMMVKP